MFLYSSNLIQFHIKELFKMPSVCTITAEHAMHRSLASDAYLEARHTRTGPDVTWKRMRWVSTYHMSLFICRRLTIKIKKKDFISKTNFLHLGTVYHYNSTVNTNRMTMKVSV